MKLRKNMVLVIGGGCALILMTGALFMLLKCFGAYRQVKRDLQNSMTRLMTLQHSTPYPSEENVTMIRTNRAVLQNYFDELFKQLRQGQIEPSKMEPAEFPLLIEKSMRKLLSRARESGVVLPEKFALGVERYAMGALPNSSDVPRLVVQLKTIESLCDLLFQAKIAEIVSVQRQVFEKSGDSPGPSAEGGSSSGASSVEFTDLGGLFSKEHFTMTFKCHELAVWDILNRLDKSQLFTVITRVNISNDNPLSKLTSKQPTQLIPGLSSSAGSVFPQNVPGRPAPGSTALEGAKTEILPREQRVVAGREMVKVVLDMDVYRFPIAEPLEANP